MASSSRFFRADFDRRRDFVATRDFLYDSVSYIPGQRIDKTQFSDRRLRQLYDQRRIGYPEQLPTLKTLSTFHEQGDQQPKPDVVVITPKPKIERYRPKPGTQPRRVARS
jgi:hypothetical protein